MGKIRRNVNWKAGIIAGETGETGFMVIGDRNPYVVHAGMTDAARGATVRFEQCELSESNYYKYDDCFINQRNSHSFTFKYYDYNTTDSTDYSRGAYVVFLNEEDEVIYQGTIGEDGTCVFKDTSGDIESVRAHVVYRNVRFNETYETNVSPLEAFQTQENEKDGEIFPRVALASATYDVSVDATIEREYDYDNDEIREIQNGEFVEVYMLHNSETINGQQENIEPVCGQTEFVTCSNGRIRFNRTNIDEISSTTTYDDAVVRFFYGDDEETIRFKAPNRFRLRFSTNYKPHEEFSYDDVSAVTTYKFDEFSTNLADEDTIAYVGKKLVPLTTSSILNITYKTVSGHEITSKEIEIPGKSDTTDWNTDGYRTYVGFDTGTFLMTNSPSESWTNKIYVEMPDIKQSDVALFNAVHPITMSTGGAAQIRSANEKNSEAQKSLGLYNTAPNGGLLRYNGNEHNRLKIIDCDVHRIGSSSWEITNLKITSESDFSDLYFGARVNSPSYVNKSNTYSTFYIVPSTGATDVRLLSSYALGFRWPKMRLVNDKSIALDNYFNTLKTTTQFAKYEGSEEISDIPTFGIMYTTKSKYIVYTARDQRKLVIVSRDSGSTINSKIENDIFQSSSSYATARSFCPDLKSLQDLEATVLIRDGVITDWHDDDIEFKLIADKIKVDFDKSVVTNVLFPNSNGEIIGFVYDIGSDYSNDISQKNLSLDLNHDDDVFTLRADLDFYTPQYTPDGDWYALENEVIDASEVFSADSEVSSAITVTPMFINRDDEPELTVFNTYTSTATSEPKYSYMLQLSSTENGTSRIYNDNSFYHHLHYHKLYKGFSLNVSPNSTSDFKLISFKEIHKDKYHFDRYQLIDFVQPEVDEKSSYFLYENSSGVGGVIRYTRTYNLLQLYENYTDEQLKTFLEQNVLPDNLRFNQTKFYAVFLSKDTPLNDGSDTGNTPQRDIWEYDFSQFTYNAYSEYLTFKSSDGSPFAIRFSATTENDGKKIYYRLTTYANAEWLDWNIVSGKTKEISGTTIQVKGNLTNRNNNGIGKFITNPNSGTCSVSGSVMTLLYETSQDAGQHSYFGARYTKNNDETVVYHFDEGNNTFKSLFEECEQITDVSKVFLPPGNTKEGCYKNMFKGCTRIDKTPMLQSTTMETGCYDSMFSGCSSLNEIYVMSTNEPPLSSWTGIASSGKVIVNGNLTLSNNDQHTPSGWTIPNFMSGWSFELERDGRTRPMPN